MIRAVVPAIALASLALCLTGCSSAHHDTIVPVSSGGYSASFEHAKQVLRDANFDLDRVDARSGVVTTKPKHSAGLATPWDLEQSTLADETNDLLSDRSRQVRIWFEPASSMGSRPSDAPLAPAFATIPVEPGAPGAPGTMPMDLRTYDGAIRARIDVVVLSTQRPSTRLDSTTIRLRSFSWDPAMARRGLYPTYEVPVGRDERLEHRIAGALYSALRRDGLAPSTQE